MEHVDFFCIQTGNKEKKKWGHYFWVGVFRQPGMSKFAQLP